MFNICFVNITFPFCADSCMLYSFRFYFYIFYITIAITEYTSHQFDVNEVLYVDIVNNECLHMHREVKFCLVLILPCVLWGAEVSWTVCRTEAPL